jgi:hypothetical protein
VSNEAKFGEIRNTLDEKLSHNRQELTDGLSLVNERLSHSEVTVESDELDESDVMATPESTSSSLLANEHETLSTEALR